MARRQAAAGHLRADHERAPVTIGARIPRRSRRRARRRVDDDPVERTVCRLVSSVFCAPMTAARRFGGIRPAVIASRSDDGPLNTSRTRACPANPRQARSLVRRSGQCRPGGACRRRPAAPRHRRPAPSRCWPPSGLAASSGCALVMMMILVPSSGYFEISEVRRDQTTPRNRAARATMPAAEVCRRGPPGPAEGRSFRRLVMSSGVLTCRSCSRGRARERRRHQTPDGRHQPGPAPRVIGPLALRARRPRARCWCGCWPGRELLLASEQRW